MELHHFSMQSSLQPNTSKPLKGSLPIKKGMRRSNQALTPLATVLTPLGNSFPVWKYDKKATSRIRYFIIMPTMRTANLACTDSPHTAVQFQSTMRTIPCNGLSVWPCSEMSLTTAKTHCFPLSKCAPKPYAITKEMKETTPATTIIRNLI